MFILQTTTNSLDLTLLTTFINFNIYHTSALGLNLLEVYYYPFIYVFILITILSIIFCLIYNKDELISFIFYVILILLSGYILFITDSLILFFFAYEMLLVPSFFILYKFAKTRRCVEAAYLMFF
jgi:formate hydrogenlyase subunit 3/multisubunit Na+/H+ antiporter MnhD subunit